MRPAAIWVWPVGLAVLVAVWVLAPLGADTVVRRDGVPARVYNPDHVGATSDAWDYLQQARQLSEGAPFTSLFTYVPYLPESLPRRVDGAFPQLWRQPGYPVLIAAAFAAAREHEPNAVLVLHGLAIVLLPLAVYACARAALEAPASGVAAALTVLSPIAVGAANPLAPTVVFVAGLTAWLALLIRGGPRLWVSGGLAAGALALIRLEMWVLLPPALIACGWFRANTRLRAGGLLLIAIVIALPWQVHVARSTSAPHNVRGLYLNDTPDWARWDAHRSLAARDVSLPAYTRLHASSIARKSGANAARFGRDLLLSPVPGLGLIALAVVGVGLVRRRREAVGAAIATVGLIAVISPLEYSPRFIAPLLPMWTIAGVMGLDRIRRRWPGPGRRIVLVVVLCLVAAVNLARVAALPPPDPASEVVREVAALDLVPTSASPVMSSQVPTLVSWVWHVPSIWSPIASEAAAVQRLLPTRTVSVVGDRPTDG